MVLNKFDSSSFGTIHTITDVDKIRFVGTQISKLWGHTNLKQAVTRICEKDEYEIVKFCDNVELKKMLLSNQLLGSHNASCIMLLSESALYKLMLSSNLKKAKPFKQWITQEVIPGIRESGGYSQQKNCPTKDFFKRFRELKK